MGLNRIYPPDASGSQQIEVPVRERVAEIEQMCAAPSDAYTAAEWRHAANDLLELLLWIGWIVKEERPA